jgi:hypothetical protein
MPQWHSYRDCDPKALGHSQHGAWGKPVRIRSAMNSVSDSSKMYPSHKPCSFLWPPETEAPLNHVWADGGLHMGSVTQPWKKWSGSTTEYPRIFSEMSFTLSKDTFFWAYDRCAHLSGTSCSCLQGTRGYSLICQQSSSLLLWGITAPLRTTGLWE